MHWTNNPWGLPFPVLCRCAEAFVSAGRHDAAVRLLVKGRQLEQALDLLLAHEVPLTEELAEALTPPKAADNADQRNAVLLRLAQVREEARCQHATGLRSLAMHTATVEQPCTVVATYVCIRGLYWGPHTSLQSGRSSTLSLVSCPLTWVCGGFDAWWCDRRPRRRACSTWHARSTRRRATGCGL